MVDRIVPSTTQTDIADSAAEGIPDRGVINTEPFKQWAIENSLFANTPDWSSVGVTLVDEVLPHETVKLRFSMPRIRRSVIWGFSAATSLFTRLWQMMCCTDLWKA